MTDEQQRAAMTLEGMVALVEQAARTIERLQTENTALKARLAEIENAAAAAAAIAPAVASEAPVPAPAAAPVPAPAEDEALQARQAEQAQRLQEAEQHIQELRRDAEWFRWFHRKYSDSTFYHHIERIFAAEHGMPVPEESSGTMIS
ncbi:hypothetical protein [Noviherbaspirillum galbum]|uniref:Uncharacterized protein n=1 Tax=Noviherbaspirillum galbum TaxID=2709383 RepID=A0A6B3SI90_9BURK|nr:hypothetical protein [Noviherbaspirillum galbum]NEX60531.1 hypothetical protein [Noviherbaspirillum galbum]